MFQSSRKMLAVWLTIISIYLSTPACSAAKILAVFPHTGKSHFFMFKPFVYKLAERGHQIHVITHFPDEKPPPNITFISIRNESEEIFFNSFSMELIEAAKYSQSVASLITLRSMGINACEGLGHPNFQNFLQEKHEFDLAIVEFFNTDCFACLAHVYNVPLVGIFSSVMMPWHNERFGNPDNPSYVSNHFLQHMSTMSFMQRVHNTIVTYGSKILYRFLYDPWADSAVRKYLGDGIPPVREIVKKSSLFLLNSHFSLFQPRPLVPGIVELGGFHVTPSSNDIPLDVLKFIEESKEGVIFFSFGSTVRGSTIPKARLRIFQKVLGKAPMRVLWKWEDDVMEGKPDNVKIGKWFPQNEILGHPNVKLFITHSGLMGTEEAVYHGVPMLMLPLFGDQPVNAASAAEKGVGVLLDYYSLTEESLEAALKEVITNKRYTENAKRLAKIFLDRPLTILDTAIYWTEYVLRYEGAPHLRCAAANLDWYQEYLLDVFAFIAVITGSFLYITLRIFRILIKTLFGKSKKQKKN